MIVIDIKEDQIERAKTLYPFDNLKGSITNGKSNIYGALGEIIVFDWFSKITKNIEFTSTYDYDMIIFDQKVDIKTKKTTVEPLPHYLCSISAFNIKQKCNGYIFVRIKNDFSKGYILGYLGKKLFFENAIFKNRGETDINGWKFKDDCYNLEIGKLKKL